MFVAASLECLPDRSFEEAIELLNDLEFTAVEIDLHADGHIDPAALLTTPEEVVHRVRHSHRLDISGYSVELEATGAAYYKLFDEICKFAKATRVVTLTVPSAELGTPFNEEVEHLQRLVDLAEAQGARVAVKCELGRLSEDPDTLMVLCDNVHGLGITMDPSVFICGPAKNKNLDRILKYVFNIHFRDSLPDKFHVSVGQGEIDYGKWITQLEREGYDRALTVHLPPLEGLDHRVELRKLRRLLESSL
ncbi:sugar phosphate isomerase/epimerase family protein [Roseimaritima ulvae]|uniref:Xylose isomerase-like TIM barrel n=1 Tax=Roseimaritima ulvae TaxID=980254 RepID=A0A5B9QPJ0_9BACT|nr:TIM barrel protein [Roseimaritima ulvae]QEG39822.1 Xylose isomerase-like TIM barrel [Roseimaritima ulvae]